MGRIIKGLERGVCKPWTGGAGGVCKPWTGGAGAGEGCLQALDRWGRGRCWRGVSASVEQRAGGGECVSHPIR